MLTYLVLAALLLVLLTVLLLWYVIRMARKRAEAQSVAAAEVSMRRSMANLRWSFMSAVAHIEANLASRWRRYRIPWIMLLGDTGAGKSTLIECSGIDRAFEVASGSVQHVGVGWNYFNRGVVLDVAGEYLAAGAGGGDQAWQTLLHLTEKYRPQRPIDGVVLAISVSDLLSAERSSMEEIAHKGELMHRRLWQAQTRFGIRFPVYVVITQCDRIAGFSSFVRALPAHMRDGMLGWSNPYDFETGYQSEWAEHGVDAMVQDVFATQAELLAAGRTADDPDAFVLFPSALAAARVALRAYLDQVFRPSAYHETFYFRGIYLSGDAGPVAQTESKLAGAAPSADAASPTASPGGEASMPEAGPAREPVFVRDLFERKVFAEFGLARASREALATRNRTVRVLRWSTAVLGLGWAGTLVVAAIQLESKVKAYTEALDVMVAATKERTASHASNVHLPVDWYLRNTNRLLDKMAPLGGVRLWWFSMPGSWPGVTPIHGEIQEILYQGFQDIVFESVRKGLNVKVSEVTGLPRHEITTELLGDPADCGAQRAGGQAEPAPLTAAIEDLPEFARLRENVQGMETLEANLGTFGRIRRGEGEMQDLRALLRYTWRIELPESLDRGGYQAAAMHQPYVFKTKNPGDVYAVAAPCAFGRGIDRIYSRFFAQYQALLLSQDIAAQISALSEQAGSADREDDPYAALLERIDTLDALLKNPRGKWLATGERELGAPFDELLQHVTAVSSLGSMTSQAARTKAQAEIEKLRKDLGVPSAEAIGPIVRRSAEGAWAVSPEVAGFQSALATLLKQRFMADAEGRRLEVRVDPGTVVRWDVKRLDEAIALAEEQRRYLKDNLGKFPPMLQEEIRDIADRHLARRLTDLVAKSESIAADAPKARDGISGAEASMDSHDFDRAGPQLVRLLNVLKEVGADATYEDLASLLKRDAVRGLLAINRSLDASELYAVRDGNFSWWQGAKNPAAGAFRAPDPQALADFLGQQYAQVEWLAKLSGPLLAVVDSANMRLDAETLRVVRRLRGIIREVDRFKNKNPKSSVVELEAFVRTEMAEVDGHNCVEKIAPKLGAVRDADFFLDRQVTLRQQLYARCVELVTAEADRAYRTIEESFARTLAGRFPFGQPAERGGAGEADPEDVVQFLRLYDRHAKSVLPVLGGNLPSSGSNANAGRFLDQMGRVRTFLGPLMPAEDGAQPAGYELGVEFRVNQAGEIDGNKIVDWALQVGDRTVRLRDANHQARWRPGMPITLSLRWAKDASSAPVNDGTLAHLSVDGKNVIYRFTDPWALVSMLKIHAAGPGDSISRAEARPHTLKFEFATQPIPSAGQYRSNLPESLAKVFIRITVTPGGKKDILSLPAFPSETPRSALEPDNGPRRSGPVALVARPGARPGWPDAYSGMPLRMPAPNPASASATAPLVVRPGEYSGTPLQRVPALKPPERRLTGNTRY